MSSWSIRKRFVSMEKRLSWRVIIWMTVRSSAATENHSGVADTESRSGQSDGASLYPITRRAFLLSGWPSALSLRKYGLTFETVNWYLLPTDGNYRSTKLATLVTFFPPFVIPYPKFDETAILEILSCPRHFFWNGNDRLTCVAKKRIFCRILLFLYAVITHP